MAYGAQEKRITSQLVANPDIMREMSETVAKLIEAGTLDPSKRDSTYRRFCNERASEIYRIYHDRFPGIKKITKLAELKCLEAGFIFNAYGRRRHIPSSNARIAFNSLIQGCAMDYIKNRMIATAPRFNKWMRESEIHILLNVHDECLYEGPKEVMQDPVTQKRLKEILEDQDAIKFRVPFAWDFGYSEETWRGAGIDQDRRKQQEAS